MDRRESGTERNGRGERTQRKREREREKREKKKKNLKEKEIAGKEEKGREEETSLSINNSYITHRGRKAVVAQDEDYHHARHPHSGINSD